MKACVIHPDQEARLGVVGHPVCDGCFIRYNVERLAQQAFKDRIFLQEILRKGYQLDEILQPQQSSL